MVAPAGSDITGDLPSGDWQIRTVRFAAPGTARTAPITWGQRALWMAIRRHGPGQVMFTLRRAVPVPRRHQHDPDRVLAAVAALVSRHASLRTRLDLTGDEPRQLVADQGEIPVSMVTDSAGDATVIGRTVAERLAATPFAHADEWPQRFALVTVDDAVRQIVVVFSHTTVDFRAAELVLRDLRLLLSRGAIDTPPGLQSADVAQLEQQDRHQRRSARAAAYWVDVTRQLSRQTRLPELAPLTPRFRRGVLVSQAADTAVRLLAERHQTTSSTVLLGAAAIVVGAWSGQPVVGMHTMVNNRMLAGYPEAIAKLNQLALVPVDLTAGPAGPDRRPDLTGRLGLAELMPRVWQAALDGYRHAYYDPLELAAAFEAAGLPYATGVNPHCYLNDIRLAPDVDLFGRPVTESEVRDAMSRTSFVLAERFEHFTWRTRIEILDKPDGLGLALTADTTYFTLDDIERFLRTLEGCLVDAAFPTPRPTE
ncbi:condensation domain-containing protein [Solwaraspora sp. WMMD406]|uniref:condensation domain-containing protein n=1 Tax=Solwaraspora sp. WMMD406 TaxID=3016095 RepID=UPI002416F326|nr:condensation domain-containing protein [Solwaraspora sp. WMMD406]MDG4762724.1 condensation domain-containing protein [Solwaraspora sp. WMMD406]